MNLNFTLPGPEARLAAEEGLQTPVYCAPFDVTPDGKTNAHGWLVADENQLLILQQGEIRTRLPLEEGLAFRCEVMVGGGLLVCEKDGAARFLARVSMRHMSRYSYIARGLQLLCKKKSGRVESLEPENFCPKCQRAIPGTRACPYCSQKGRFTRRLAVLAGNYIPALLGLSAVMLLVTFITVGMRFVERQYIDNVLIPRQNAGGELGLFAFISLGSGLLFMLLVILRDIIGARIGTRLSMDLRARLYNKIQALSLADINKRQPGELLNRVTGDTENIRHFMQETFALLFNHLIISGSMLVVMLLLNWRLTLISLAMVPVAAVLASSVRGLFRRIFHNQWRMSDQMNSQLQDVLSGIRVVKSFGMEKREMDKFAVINKKYADIQVRNERFWSTFNPVLQFVLGLGSYLLLVYGGIQVLNIHMTVGELNQFGIYCAWIYGPLGWFTSLPRQLANTVTSLERIFDVLDEENNIRSPEQAIAARLEGDVEFNEVTFGYRSYEPVLEGISAAARPGERIGLVGASGTGKSTMINLLMRLYDTDEGAVRIDGQDIRQYALDSLHSQMGVVLQEPFLFSGTIIDNIRYSKPGATREEVIRTAKIANAHDFISKLPDGYDTRVGEHGYTLSGGERQRVSIARALLNDPRILILDEATSSLDTETEYQIQLALDRLMKGRTSFAIAHRLSTLRNCDRIWVLDKHHLAEMGTHDELMRKKGIYYGLVMAQLQMHKVKGETA